MAENFLNVVEVDDVYLVHGVDGVDEGAPVQRRATKYSRYTVAHRVTCQVCGQDFWAWPSHGARPVYNWDGSVGVTFENKCARCLWDLGERADENGFHWSGMFAK